MVIPFTDFLKAYPEVEKYLVDNVATDSVDENMSKARELLQLELSKNADGQRMALIEALQRFVSLADPQDVRSQCHFNRYITLYYNYLASRSSQGASSLRVGRIVDQFGLRHAQLCTDFYGDQVRARYEQMSADGGGQLKPELEALLDSALRSATGPNMVEDLVGHFQAQNAPVLGSSQGPLMFATLVKQSASDGLGEGEKEGNPDAGHLFTECQQEERTADDEDDGDETSSVELIVEREKYEALERLFDRYVRQPCKSLVASMRDVMEPAAFAALYQAKRQADFFYLVWARYKLCDTMSSQVRQKLLTSLVQASCDAHQQAD